VCVCVLLWNTLNNLGFGKRASIDLYGARGFGKRSPIDLYGARGFGKK
jgi:hypothetical protein